MRKWPIGSTVALMFAVLILAAEYLFFGFTSVDVWPALNEPATSKVDLSPELPDDLEWHDNSALSPDGSKIVHVVDLPAENSLAAVPKLVVESASTHRELAHLVLNFPCRLFLESGCHINKLAWVNNSKIAFVDVKAGTRVWEWKTSRPIMQTLGVIEFLTILFGLPLGLSVWAIVNGIRATRQNTALQKSG